MGIEFKLQIKNVSVLFLKSCYQVNISNIFRSSGQLLIIYLLFPKITYLPYNFATSSYPFPYYNTAPDQIASKYFLQGRICLE